MSVRIEEQGSVGLVETQSFTFAHPPEEVILECGQYLGPVTLAYETYGRLSAARDNSILILHALTGDAHVAGYHSIEDRQPGWWDGFVGPGKAFDTDHYFVICSNILGGCKGSTGPSSINPRTGRPYGIDFPMVTVGDMVRAQRVLIDHLGIDRLHCVVGGSLGGMQVLDWIVRYPDRVRTAIPIGTALRLSTLGLALDEVGRQAIMADPNWRGGHYYGHSVPARGLAIARMIGHVSYLSYHSLREKFGRQLQRKDRYDFTFDSEFAVESYLAHQGDKLVSRFDANSYLYLSRAMGYFDLLEGGRKTTQEALEGVKAKCLVLSYKGDWLFPTCESEQIAAGLKANGAQVAHVDFDSDYGHDAFLLEHHSMAPIIRDFLDSTYHDRPPRRVKWL